jgi:hypothetical protein
MLLKDSHHRWIFLLALCLVAVGLPVSKAFMSIGGLLLAANFLLEGRYYERWKKLISSPLLIALTSVYLVHVIGLLWTNDYAFAFKDLRVKLPLLLYPIVLALSDPLKRKEFLLLTGLFAATVILTSFISTYEYLQIRDQPNIDFRSISLFTSHIRYALMVCLAYLFLLHLAWNEDENIGARLSYTLLAVWLSVFVFILQSMTGIVIWLLCSYLLLLYTLSFIKSSRLKTIGYTALTITPLIVGFYIVLQVDAFYPDEKPDFSKLPSHTVGNEAYTHDTTSLNLENGHYINLFLAPEELEREWNKRSELKFWTDRDRSGQAVNATLIRYLTSKGLRKDSAGINALTDDDIEAVENGIANVRFIYGNPIDNRVYTVIWEFDRMMKEKRVQGHSVTQRLVFWQTGWEIFKEHWLFGVGTGDINLSFDDMYDRMNIKLLPEYRLRTHNQYLAIAISFGMFGVVVFLLSILLPFFLNAKANSFLYIGFSIILYASMLNEDTLETQNGVTLFAFFNALLLFGRNNTGQASQTEA